MSTATRPDHARSRTRRSGPGTEPPLGPLAALATLLLVGGAVAGALTGAPVPSPLAGPAEISTYVTGHRVSLLVTALGTLTAAVPFTIFVSLLAARLRLLGIVRGGSSLAQTAGAGAAGMLALSALFMWALTRPGVAGDSSLHQALFAGVIVTGAGFTLFLALTVTALVGPARRTGILRPAAIVTGYLLILTAAACLVGLAWSPALVLLPVARYGTLAWLAYAAFALPTSRAHVRPAT